MTNFIGEYRYSLDEKYRVNVPAKFRKQLIPEAQETFVTTRGLEQCLFVYPLDEWEKYMEKLRMLPGNKKQNRHFIRMITSHASEEKYDKQGRIKLPGKLLKIAGIDKEVMIIGSLEHIEIWNPETFAKYLDDEGKTFEDIAEDILL